MRDLQGYTLLPIAISTVWRGHALFHTLEQREGFYQGADDAGKTGQILSIMI